MRQFVFVSHANKDKVERPEALRRLLDALTDSGVKVWIDSPARLGYDADEIERRFLRLKVGGAYEKEIDLARDQAGVVLGVWSANVVAAFDTATEEAGRILRNELNAARDKSTLACCRIDDVSPTSYPNDFHKEQVADARPDAPHYQTELAELVRGVKQKLRTPFFRDYRENRIKEWSSPRYGAGDKLFTELALLLDRGAQSEKRWDEQDDRYDTLREALDQARPNDKEKAPYPAVVLLGAPGSGKSTLLRHFDIEVARRAEDWPSDAGPPPFSYFASLKEYSIDGRTPASAMQWLADRWDKEWRKENLHIQSIEELLKQPETYLLLDALNEMPRGLGKSYEEMIADWKAFIAKVRTEKWPCRIIFSCRSLLYSNQLSDTGDEMVPHINILPLDAPKIEEFLGHYAGDRAPELFARIEDQLDLYGTAYFLRMLVEVAGPSGEVPRDRAALFTAFVRMLLAREYLKPNPTITNPGALSKDDVSRLDSLAYSPAGWRTAYELLERGPLFKQLGSLAYSMQRKSGRGADEEHLQLVVGHDEALRALEPARGGANEARTLLQAACDLSLLEHDRGRDEVQFVHQLIQEYFAGRRLAENREASLVNVGWRSSEVGERIPGNVNEPLPPADSTGWEETTLFAVLMTQDREKFIRELMQTNLPLAGRAAAQVRASARQEGAKRAAPALTDAVVRELRENLRERMTNRRGALRARIAAGKALGDLGDDRFIERRGHSGRAVLEPPLLRVDRGTYYIGQPSSPHTTERERNAVKLDAFSIAQFPVTNAEWRQFMQAGGYADERWWRTKAAKLWRSGETTHAARTVQWYAFRIMLQQNDYIDRKLREGEISEKIAEDHYKARDKSPEDFAASMRADYDGKPHTEPRRWRESAFNNPLQPVVGISWYEANAYCAWLSAETGATWRLPTEAEWEAAARLGTAKNAIYPWGDKFDPSRCNTFLSHIRATTPVGLYLGRKSGGLAALFAKKPELELADVSGNAFEWTSSCYDKQRYGYPYRADDGREDLEDQPGRDDDTSRVMTIDLNNRARSENWSADKLTQAIEVARYFPRVLRGGSFYYWPDEARLAFRLRFHPGYHNQSTGFRLVREA